MNCTRIYTGPSGDSCFEQGKIDLKEAGFGAPAVPLLLSEPFDATKIIFATIPVGLNSDLHNAPQRQFFLQLTGTIEVESASGETVRTGPGEVTLIEDTAGTGHMTRVIGDVPVIGAFVQLPD